MLSPALLNLDSYFYTEINVSVNMELLGEASSFKVDVSNLSNEFVVHEDSTSGDNLLVSLKVTTDESDAKLALSIEVGVIGRFIFSEELKSRIKDKKTNEEVVVANALSILYTSIRDQVYSITSKMPCGSIFLPTCNFNVRKNEQPKDLEPQRKSSVRSPKKTGIKKPA